MIGWIYKWIPYLYPTQLCEASDRSEGRMLRTCGKKIVRPSQLTSPKLLELGVEIWHGGSLNGCGENGRSKF